MMKRSTTVPREVLLAKAATISAAMSQAFNAEKKPLIRDQRHHLRYIRGAFLASEAVTWAVEQGQAASRPEATHMFDDFLTVGALTAQTSKGHVFQDDKLIYCWQSAVPEGPSPEKRPSLDGEEPAGELGAKLLHLHLAIQDKVKLRQEEWKKSDMPKLKKRIEALEEELGSAKKRLEFAVDQAKKCATGTVPETHLTLIDDLETAVALIGAEIDNQKQLLHFPEPEGWTVRLGSEGVYMAVKNVEVDKIEAKWSMRAGSYLSANPSIKGSVGGHQLHLKLAPITLGVAFSEISIVGEKGSSVPSVQSDRLVLSMELFVEMELKFDAAKSVWTAPYFNFNLLELGKTEVTALPPALVQWAINKFLPSRIKKMVTGGIPTSLGKYLSGGGEVLEMSGDLSVKGIPFGVLEQALSLGKPMLAKDCDTDDLGESHYSALKLLGTGEGGKHGHVLAKLRRRLQLGGLKKAPLFKACGTWSKLSRLMQYVRTIDRETSKLNYEEILLGWQAALNVCTSEDGLSPIDLKDLFDRLRRLDRVPLEVRFAVTEFNGSVDMLRGVDFIRDFAREMLRQQKSGKTEFTNVKELIEIRQAQMEEQIDAWYKEARQTLRGVHESISQVSVGLSGRLLGGTDGVFDFGADEVLVRLKPHVQMPLDKLLIAPSDTSVSLFAVEDNGGRFVMDLGVPKSTLIAQGEYVALNKDTSQEPAELLALCVEGVRRCESVRRERAPSCADVYTDSKYFPQHDRVVMATVGSSSMSLRADPTALAAALAELPKARDGLVDLFELGFLPNGRSALNAQQSTEAKSPAGVMRPIPTTTFSTASTASGTSGRTLPPPLSTGITGGANSAPNSPKPVFLPTPTTAPSSFVKALVHSAPPTPKKKEPEAPMDKKEPPSESPKPTISEWLEVADQPPPSPKYEVGLRSLPHVFAQLSVTDLRVVGAPRRITRFVQATLRDAEEKKREAVQFLRDYEERKKFEERKEILQGEAGAKAPASDMAPPPNMGAPPTLAPLQADPLQGALESFISTVASRSMIFRFKQSVDVKVQGDKLFLSMSQSNNRLGGDARALLLSNTYFARDVIEQGLKIQAILDNQEKEKVGVEAEK